ncbi:flagellar basal body P-ring protein FlgI [bacterium]|nr:flagellar basal body P-ring protein FlgI [bacterium]
MKTRRLHTLLLMLLLPAIVQGQTRIKDIAEVEGVNSYPLIGYGIVVGLDGSGDSRSAIFTNQSVLNMLDRFGISLDSDRIRLRNVAATMVTADLPPFTKEGQRVDVLVSSMGDARSLSGGTLLLTPLVDPDGTVYGMAQGPVSVGGFAVEAGAVSLKKNVSSVARVPKGLLVERDYTIPMDGLELFRYVLNEGDFTTSRRVATAINNTFGEPLATPLDPVSIEVAVPPDYPGGSMALIGDTENLVVQPDVEARVIINERTGTVVIGAEVNLSSVAISHGSISISVASTPIISQPGPFSQGRTTVQRQNQIQVQQEATGVQVIENSTDVGAVATALNNLGVSPRDIIAIFQALKEAGALQAELVII